MTDSYLLPVPEGDTQVCVPEAPKSHLVEVPRLRFGLPEARLRRMPTDQVIEAIEAAAAHEGSLNIIERNAESSGRARSS